MTDKEILSLAYEMAEEAGKYLNELNKALYTKYDAHDINVAIPPMLAILAGTGLSSWCSVHHEAPHPTTKAFETLFKQVFEKHRAWSIKKVDEPN